MADEEEILKRVTQIVEERMAEREAIVRYHEENFREYKQILMYACAALYDHAPNMSGYIHREFEELEKRMNKK